MVAHTEKKISGCDAALIVMSDLEAQKATLQGEIDTLRKRFSIPVKGGKRTLADAMDEVLNAADYELVPISEIGRRIGVSDTKPAGKYDDGSIRKCFSECNEERHWSKGEVGGAVAYGATKRLDPPAMMPNGG